MAVPGSRLCTICDAVSIPTLVPDDPSTLFRWASKGLRGVRLEVIRIGGTQCTSVEALARFFHRLSEHAEPPAAPTPATRSITPASCFASSLVRSGTGRA